MTAEIRKEDGVNSLLVAAVEQSPAPTVITDLKGNICYCNAAFCQSTGYSAKELLGKNPRVLQSGFTPGSIYKELWSTVLSGNTWQGELCNKSKSGKIYWETIAVSPLKDAAGKVNYLIGVWLNVTDKKFEEGILKSRVRNLEQETALDSLTGHYNRRHIMKELGKEVDRAIRYKRFLSGLMFDIDDFKKINDEHGHLAGDYVLKEVTSVVEKNIRNVDILGRYGGDEFLVIFPESNMENVKIVAERVRKGIETHVFEAQGARISVTVSMGLCTFFDGKIDDKIIFLGKIDHALLEAKKLGKNQIVAHEFN